MAEKKDFTKDKEIDLIDLLNQLWRKKKTIIYSAILSGVLGVVIALMIPNTYTSGVTFIPQLNSGGLESPSGLSGLASLAGIELNGSSNSKEIPPSLYPRIVASIPFRKDLLSMKVDVEDTTYILSDYLLQREDGNGVLGFILKYTIGLPKLIFGQKEETVVRDENGDVFYMTESDHDLFKILDRQLALELYEKEGFVGLSFSDENKYVTAQVSSEATRLLQECIIEFRNKAAKELLAFTEKQYNDKRNQFNALQDSFALYKDGNQGLVTAYSQIQTERLARETSIAASVLEQLASQVEQARLKVNQDTPVFMIIEPVYVPFRKTAPKRAVLVVMMVMVGVVLTAFYILVRKPLWEIVADIRRKPETPT